MTVNCKTRAFGPWFFAVGLSLVVCWPGPAVGGGASGAAGEVGSRAGGRPGARAAGRAGARATGRPAAKGKVSKKVAAEARKWFERGVRDFEAGNFAAALADFAKSYEVLPHYRVLKNMGLCYSKLNKHLKAIQMLERFLRSGKGRISAAEASRVQQEVTKLRALTAELTVSTNAAGASVVVDGETVGVSPLAGPVRVSAGHHVVEVRMAGWKPARKEVTLAGGTWTKVSLVLEKITTFGRLSVVSPAPGARVFVDGKEMGPSPFERQVAAGGHVVEVRAAAHRSDRRDVEVPVNGRLVLRVTLRKLVREGTLVVGVNVAGARVYVDGQDMGPGAPRAFKLEAGPHEVEVKKTGFFPLKTTVRLKEDTSVSMNVDMGPKRPGLHPAFFWSAVGLTASFLAAGAATGALALDARKEFNSLTRNDPRVPSVERKGERLALASDLCWAGAAIAAGAALILGFRTAFKPRKSTADIRVGFAPARSGAALAAAGSF